MWSDPSDDGFERDTKWEHNDKRDCSYFWGKKPTGKLLKKLNLLSIFRGHQVQQEGYKMHKWGSNSSFPYVITVFSAPNYCGTYNNKGAVLCLKDDTLNLRSFQAVDAPYTLPDDLNIFSWSLPFVTEKVMAVFTHLVSMCSK